MKTPNPRDGRHAQVGPQTWRIEGHLVSHSGGQSQHLLPMMEAGEQLEMNWQPLLPGQRMRPYWPQLLLQVLAGISIVSLVAHGKLCTPNAACTHTSSIGI